MLKVFFEEKNMTTIRKYLTNSYLLVNNRSYPEYDRAMDEEICKW